MRWKTVLATAVLSATLAWAGEGAREAVSKLAPPEGAPQREARGACDLRDGPDFQRFRVVVEGVDERVGLVLLLGDGRENLVAIGEMPSGSRVRTFLRTTLEGGELPLGVESVAALEERRIVIQDGEERTVLEGHVPVFRTEAPPPGNGGDGGDDGNGGGVHDEPLVAKATMHATDAGVEGDREPRGTLVAVRRAESSALKVEAGRLAPERGYLVYAGREDRFDLVDDVRTNGDGGFALVRDTLLGHDLPLGAESIGDLAGARVEVRDLEGRVVLHGEFPRVESEQDLEPVHHEETVHDEETGADAEADVRVDPEKGHERLLLSMRRLPRRAGRGTADVVMDDGTGVLTSVARVRIRSGGRARRVWNTRRGDELPFRAASLRSLGGRAFEVRVRGVRAAAGRLPLW